MKGIIHLWHRVRNLTEVEKLKISLGFGWSVLAFFLLLLPTVLAAGKYHFGESFLFGAVFAGFILSIRYSTLKPVLRTGVAAAGWATFATAFALMFGRRNDASGAWIGAFTGGMLVLIVVFCINAIRAYYYLSRETFYYVRHVRAA